MRIDNEAWNTLYDETFSKEKYLYHFTNINNAVKILFFGQLKFSKISHANDPLESKPKLNVNDKDNRVNILEAIRHFQEVNRKYLRMLCFTRDKRKPDKIVDDFTLYTDYSGRGFALPRMWAQYSENNRGVCLVFERKRIIKLISNELKNNLLHHGKISYISQFDKYSGEMGEIGNLLEAIKKYSDSVQQGLYDISFFKNNLRFVKYNYFSKLDDWSGENEYRFLAFGSEDYYIDNITEALSGVIIGEKTEEQNESIIKMFCKDICEVKKITFTYNGCMLKNISLI